MSETQLLKQYEDGLKCEKERKNSSNAVDNIRRFYDKNKAMCQKSLKYFSDAEKGINAYVCNRGEISADMFCKMLLSIRVLVITVNPIETAVFLHWLSDQNSGPVDSYLVNTLAYTIYNTKKGQTIIHVNAKRTGENVTRQTINQVTKVFEPSYIIMLGICYGLDMEKYSIGSVFVSDSIETFRLNFRDEINSDETVFEAEDEYNESPDHDLIQRIQQFLSYSVVYHILSEDSQPTTAKSEVGKLLSCNSLVSSRKVKQAVMKQYSSKRPKALGGEMEGAGLLKSYYVEEKSFSRWLIIKSICDWGEKKNALDNNARRSELIKDSLQAYAMANTCGAFSIILKLLH